MKGNYFLTLFIILFAPQYIFAQNIADTSVIWDGIEMEKLIETVTHDDENSTIVEELIEFEENPIDLNDASIEELIRIPNITSLVASNILDRKLQRPFTSINELLTIDGITAETFAFIRRFVTVNYRDIGMNTHGSLITRASTEYEKRKGYESGIYPYSPFKILNRFRFSIGTIEPSSAKLISDIKFGLVTEKDPGEINMLNLAKGYIAISTPNILKSIIVGDYQAEVGQGLVFWTASGYSKGTNVVSQVRKKGAGMRPNLSSDENSYFRGLAISMGNKEIGCEFMYSNKSLNSSIDSQNCITAIDQSGLFRTQNEFKHYESSREMMMGYNMYIYLFDGLKINVTGYRSKYLHTITIRNKYDVPFSELWMQGIDISYTTKTYEVFSEVAFDYLKRSAKIGGVTYQPINILALSVLYRNYPTNFLSIYGKGFGENNIVQNERGTYFGIRFRPLRGLWISSYYDLFENPNSSQSKNITSHGSDFLAIAEYTASKKLELSFRYKNKKLPTISEENDSYGRMINYGINREQNNYRFTSMFTPSYSIRLINKVEWINIKYGEIEKRENGLLISQSLKWAVYPSIILRCGLSIYATESYDSRIYHYEEDLRGAFSNPALYGNGLRLYVMITYQISSHMVFSTKFAQTSKEGIKSMGTGNDEIKGNLQSIISGQIEVRF